MKTQAQLFAQTLSDECNIIQMTTRAMEESGSKWGDNAYKVEFPDNSYYSAAIFHSYYNGSAKINPFN